MQLWDDDVGDGGKHSGSSTVSRVSLYWMGPGQWQEGPAGDGIRGWCDVTREVGEAASLLLFCVFTRRI